MSLRIRSAARPYDDPEVASLAAAALSRAEAMGLCGSTVDHLDSEVMGGLETRLAEAGIARSVRRPAGHDPKETAGWLQALHEALVGSPIPDSEWPAVSRSLGLDLLSRLLNISHSSVRRYLSGSRTTPDLIAARLHFLALVAGDLAGAYNEIGVRRWFDRKRTALGGKSPAQLLSGNWAPEDGGAARVRELAGALGFSPAT